MSADRDVGGGPDRRARLSGDSSTDRIPDDAESDTLSQDLETSTADLGKAETFTEPSIGSASTAPGNRVPAVDTQDTVAARPSARIRVEQARAEARATLRGSIIAGRYRVVRLIARGSMSRVYEAQQTSVRRPVALKLMSQRFTHDDQAVGRFKREAAVLAQIDHPNVVSVYDIGATEAGEHFLVMEYVDGQPMSDLIAEHGRLGPARSVGLLLQIARALARVHGAGVIHRDLKPKNVLVTTGRGGIEVAKVVDFGLAKVTDEQPGDAALTRAGTILGTPEYMSPEQVRGTKVDHRADLYSFGCVAYEMLTGRPPFIGEEMSILYRQMNEEPLPMREICPEADIPPSFQEFVDRALAKDPEERFETASEVYASLLDASDRAGVNRSELRLDASLFDDPAVAATRSARIDDVSGEPDPAETTLDLAERRPKQQAHRGVLMLGAAAVAVVGLLCGVVLERVIAGSGSSGESAAASAPATELLLVDSRPPGASVEIDGADLPETTPTAVRGIAAGRHEIRLYKEGRDAVERTISIAAGERTSIDLALPAESRELSLQTIPSGALVFLDGKLVSSHTPTRLSLAKDDFNAIRVEKNGFEPQVINLTPDDTAPELTVTLEVEQRPIGWLWIDSNDTARVWIDGLDSGFVTPTFGVRLRVGRHRVELRDSSGARSSPVEVDVRQGESQHLTLSLEKEPAGR